MDLYLTTDELSSRIKYSHQSIYNLIQNKTFVLGKHYFKPTAKKILFKWPAILEWIGDAPPSPGSEIPIVQSSSKAVKTGIPDDTPTDNINI